MSATGRRSSPSPSRKDRREAGGGGAPPSTLPRPVVGPWDDVSMAANAGQLAEPSRRPPLQHRAAAGPRSSLIKAAERRFELAFEVAVRPGRTRPGPRHPRRPHAILRNQPPVDQAPSEDRPPPRRPRSARQSPSVRTWPVYPSITVENAPRSPLRPRPTSPQHLRHGRAPWGRKRRSMSALYAGRRFMGRGRQPAHAAGGADPTVAPRALRPGR